MAQNARNGRKTAIWSVTNFGDQSLPIFPPDNRQNEVHKNSLNTEYIIIQRPLA